MVCCSMYSLGGTSILHFNMVMAFFNVIYTDILGTFLALLIMKIRIRAIVGIMMFLGYFLTYVVRNNLSVHIIDMAQVMKRDECVIDIENPNQNSCVKRTGIVDLINWDDTKVGKLFSAYHIGYCICFPIFHSVGDRLGPTWVVGIAGMLSGVLCCLTPASAYYHFWALFLVRIIKGFCAGAMQPSMVQVLRYWVPPIERNHFMWAYCGITTGTFSTFLMCAAVHYYARWPVGFYISGGLQVTWSVIWILVVTDYPRKHPCISDEELAYLFNTIGNIFPIKKRKASALTPNKLGPRHEEEVKLLREKEVFWGETARQSISYCPYLALCVMLEFARKAVKVVYLLNLTNAQAPWRLIVRSVPFWALCILNFGYSWMIISLCIHGPLYYSKVAKYSIYSASALTALPFFLRLVLGTILIQTFHLYKHKPQIKRIKHIRKYFIFVSHVIPGLLVCISWMLPIIPGPLLLTLAVALTAAGMDLTLDLCYELTPTFVNSINTVIKIIGNTSGIIVSLCVGQVTYKYKNLPIVWKHIWCFHASILFLSGLVFLIWGETEVQPWNQTRKDRPRRKLIMNPLPSIMSNISEVEEGSVRSSLAKVTPK